MPAKNVFLQLLNILFDFIILYGVAEMSERGDGERSNKTKGISNKK